MAIKPLMEFIVLCESNTWFCPPKCDCSNANFPCDLELVEGWRLVWKARKGWKMPFTVIVALSNSKGKELMCSMNVYLGWPRKLYLVTRLNLESKWLQDADWLRHVHTRPICGAEISFNEKIIELVGRFIAGNAWGALIFPENQTCAINFDWYNCNWIRSNQKLIEK